MTTQVPVDLERLGRHVLERTRAVLNAAKVTYRLEEPQLVQDEEDAGWQYLRIPIQLRLPAKRRLHLWDEVAQAAYQGLTASEASRVCLHLF